MSAPEKTLVEACEALIQARLDWDAAATLRAEAHRKWAETSERLTRANERLLSAHGEVTRLSLDNPVKTFHNGALAVANHLGADVE